jgi:transcriptional regulator EpsA
MRTEAAGLRVVRSGGRSGALRQEPLTELRLVTAQQERGLAPAAEPVVSDVVGTALLDAPNVEGLLLNLDASLRITTRAQFFSWTQGLLLSLIRHRVLVCALRRSRDPAFIVDTFSTAVANPSGLALSLAREASLISALANKWMQLQFRPFVCSTGELSDTVGGTGLRELVRAGASELLVHGTHDTDGEVQGLSFFACQAGTAGKRELYLAQLVIPSLHAAWIRTQTRPAGLDSSAGTPCILTERERGILRWVYLGKSNGEIGAILGISSLTVKNHVQKILRKLNVVNRAQAVGRALDARIIRP